MKDNDLEMEGDIYDILWAKKTEESKFVLNKTLLIFEKIFPSPQPRQTYRLLLLPVKEKPANTIQ
ncbi:CNT_collapsed_G0015980.mRNA.1.CDS.1 [Saccharomyces cerevisiae]|nr:CNT_collapsed_G0015980.mRNA.1.CDS.1 [Saccharomyces cerevisiae]